MPFKGEPRVFAREAIESIKPDQLGCYGIFNETGWIYIGKGDIRARLLDHLNGDNECITRYQPTQWVATVTSDYDQKEKELIAEYNPPCNKRAG